MPPRKPRNISSEQSTIKKPHQQTHHHKKREEGDTAVDIGNGQGIGGAASTIFPEWAM